MKVLLVVLVLVAAVKAVNWSKVTPRAIYADPVEGTAEEDERIVGGVQAIPHSFPYQVALLFIGSFGDKYFCGGSLISVNYVLTAAHCADKMVSVVVTFGAHNLTKKEPTQVQSTSRIMFVNDMWSKINLTNDIAVIRLPSPVALDVDIQLIPLPTRSEAKMLFTGDVGTVSGWGKTSDETGSISDVLMFVNSTIIANSKCTKSFPAYIKPTHICMSGAGGKSPCNGDSGGPMTTIVKGVRKQIGIVSFGSSTGCSQGYPSVFTRITSYLDWIQVYTDVIIGN